MTGAGVSALSVMLPRMAPDPLSSEVAGALAGFFHGGSGPSHSQLTTVFAGAGYGEADPYDQSLGTPNKEQRVGTVCRAAQRRPSGTRRLVDSLIEKLRLHGCFDSSHLDTYAPAAARHLRRALAQAGWSLSDEGYPTPLGDVDLSTGGREALDEQLERIRRATDDPGLLLGSAKDLLEATAKFVLSDLGIEVGSSAKYSHTQYMARDRLKLNPQDVDMTMPGAEHVRKVLQSTIAIAESVAELRALQGVGHGRTLPTGVSPELAWLVIREACSVAELMLTTLDRQYGRR